MDILHSMAKNASLDALFAFPCKLLSTAPRPGPSTRWKTPVSLNLLSFSEGQWPLQQLRLGVELALWYTDKSAAPQNSPGLPKGQDYLTAWSHLSELINALWSQVDSGVIGKKECGCKFLQTILKILVIFPMWDGISCERQPLGATRRGKGVSQRIPTEITGKYLREIFASVAHSG